MAIETFNFEKDTTINIVKKILNDALKYKATDIHLNPRKNALCIKFRIDGELTEYTTITEEYKINIVTRVKLLASMNITISDIPQKGTIIHEEKNKKFTMNTFSLPTIYGEKLVIHIANYNKNLQSLEKLGYPTKMVKEIKEILENPNGIFLITSPPLEGKTTTMYSILKEIENPKKNIITIENPIKLKLDSILQTQPNKDKGITSPQLLESILLQDPNIIAISDLEDKETCMKAISSANNNVFVLATMHTKNAMDTLEELIHQDINSYLLGKTVRGILSQRLIKKLCPHCKIERKTTKEEQHIFDMYLGKKIDTIYEASSCKECINGYKDRMPIATLFKINEEIKNYIIEHNFIELNKIVKEQETELIKEILEKVVDGTTSLEEVFANIDRNLEEKTLLNKKDTEEEIQEEAQEEKTINKTDNSPQTEKAKEKIQKELESSPIIETEVEKIEETPTKEETIPVEETLKKEASTEETTKEEEKEKRKQEVKKEEITFDYDDFSYDDSYINTF